MINGIDVSAFQPRVNWQRVYASAFQPKFAYVKFTQGQQWVSSVAATQWKTGQQMAARLNPDIGDEFYLGPYHFCEWQGKGDPVEDAISEAEHFFSNVNAAGWDPIGHLPPVADLEWITGQKRDADELVAWSRQFLKTTSELFETEPAVYTGSSFWRYCLLPDKKDLSLHLTEYALWEADYNHPPGQPQNMRGTEGLAGPGSWPWVFHQYSGHGKVDGVMDKFGRPTEVDLNVFNGSMEDLRLLARANA